MLNGSELELTELQKAQQTLLTVASTINPPAMLPSAYINGILLAARLGALVDVVGLGDPAFQQAYDAALLAQMQKLTENIQMQQAAAPRIQVGH